MLHILAHADHSHEMESMHGMSELDHCMPIMIVAGAVIVILLGIIAYLLMRGQSAASPEVKPVEKKNK